MRRINSSKWLLQPKLRRVGSKPLPNGLIRTAINAGKVGGTTVTVAAR
jgi:hypothetical protein